MSTTPNKLQPRFREVINPPLSWMVFIYFLYFSMALAIWGAFDFTAAAIVMAALTLVMPIIWWKFRMVIIVDEELRVDRAHIELKYLKEAKPVSAEQYKKLRSINSDARSFHITRPWLKTGVQVLVNDDRDPTSYWLIGCKNIEGLARALK